MNSIHLDTRVEADAEDEGLKAVRLAGGKALVVPACLELLNPWREGERGNLVLAWLVDPEAPGGRVSFDDSVEGRGICHPFGFLIDGLVPDNVVLDGLAAEEDDFLRLVGAAAQRKLPAGDSWAVSFCACDMTGQEVLVYTAGPFAYEGDGR